VTERAKASAGKNRMLVPLGEARSQGGSRRAQEEGYSGKEISTGVHRKVQGGGNSGWGKSEIGILRVIGKNEPCANPCQRREVSTVSKGCAGEGKTEVYEKEIGPGIARRAAIEGECAGKRKRALQVIGRGY